MTTNEKKIYTYNLKRISNFEIELKRYCKTIKIGFLEGETRLIETQILKFEKVSANEVVEKRCKKESGIVMIYFGEIFFAKAPKYIKISKMSELLTNHKCRDCMRLSAKSDEEGGCQKVRDFPIKYIPKGTENQEEDASTRITKRDVIDSMRIEKYPFVTFAMESINTSAPEILITDCKNFRKYKIFFWKPKKWLVNSSHFFILVHIWGVFF